MSADLRTLQVGAATVTVINTGDLQINLADALNLTEEARRSAAGAPLTQPIPLPTQCIHLALPETSVLVDASHYDVSPDSSFAIPGYQPPPGLLAGLAAIGARPEEIAHVIITHGHFDHYNGLTGLYDDLYAPTFPNARCYFGRLDWERPQTQEALRDLDSLDARTLGLLHRHGLLDLTAGDHDLGHGLRIIAAPGETPGHQIVRLHSQGETLYCLGDLYHHIAEAEQPEWMVHWADVEANRRSRQALAAAALAEDALLIATHIATIGRLRQTPAGFAWVEV